jgi:hypothetical protein
MNEQQLRSYIRNIFEGEESKDKEPTEQKNVKKTKKSKSDTRPGEVGVTAGRGRWSKEVKDAGALAEDAPEELMKNLGINKKASGFKGISSIINQALSNSSVMNKSYSGISSVKAGDLSGIMVKMKELDSRNGAKYLHHTLIGALNSETLSLNVPVQVQRLDGQTVVIYVSPKKNAWQAPAKKSKSTEAPADE